MTLLLPAALLAMTVHAEPVPVILDTDLGDDIDDTWALAMLLGTDAVDLKLVVTASDDTPTKTRLVAKILEYVDRTDVPIGTGVKTSDNPIHQAQWLGDYDLSAYKGVVHEDGVQAMIDCINGAPGPVTICVIGPQTNLREALRREPQIAGKARVVAMAGSVYIGYGGKEGRAPEWNVHKDVEAARAVFGAPWEIVMAPLDINGTLTLQGQRYLAVAESSAPLARAVIANYQAWTNRRHYAEDASSVLFDTTAAYLCFSDAAMELETVNLVIDDKGNTAPDESGRPVRCALRWKDRNAFEELLIAALTRTANAEP